MHFWSFSSKRSRIGKISRIQRHSRLAGSSWLLALSPELITTPHSLPLVDPITLVEDENGPIPRGGKRYQLEKPEIWVAQAHQLHCQVMP